MSKPAVTPPTHTDAILETCCGCTRKAWVSFPPPPRVYIALRPRVTFSVHETPAVMHTRTFYLNNYGTSDGICTAKYLEGDIVQAPDA